MRIAFDVYKNAPGEEETSHPARLPNLCFCLRFLLFVEAVPGKYYALFVWNCFLEQKGVISRQSAVKCELARQIFHLCFGWGSMVSGWLDCEWKTVTRD